ncbi:MAG: branched-chain amino acid transport system substrate-binding protein [Gammaproteobacteria bacterium]
MSNVHATQKSPVLVGLDASYSIKNSTSATAIELGVRAAVHEINDSGGVLGGRPIKLVTKDNRSVPDRGLVNLKAFAATEDMVAVFGGRFSPVLLQQVSLTHELKLPLLDVWAAADGITDHKYKPSYTFRLSLKDSWAMPVMVAHAMKSGLRKVGVMLPRTGWGRSNHNALIEVDSNTPELNVVDTDWYNFGDQDVIRRYKALLEKSADAIILVANDREASLLVRQIGEHPDMKRVPIISHWGVTGGDMVEQSGPTLWELDFSVVQSFSFFDAKPKPFKMFMKTAKSIAGIDAIEQLASPVGIAHAYDMMHILAKAINKAGSTDRVAVRDALEAGIVHHGLVRDYSPAFSRDNHDALSPAQVFMGRYRNDGAIVPIERVSKRDVR